MSCGSKRRSLSKGRLVRHLGMNVKGKYAKHIARLDLLVERINRAEVGYQRLREAQLFAAQVHSNQELLSGRPYIIHPTEVALLLRSKGFDLDTVIAGLLNNVVEDTLATLKDVEDRFGDQVARMVDDVTMANDLDTLIRRGRITSMALILCRRVITLRDLHWFSISGSPDKATLIARETLEVFVPVADSIGLHDIAQEMTEIATLHLEPSFKTVLSRFVDYRESVIDGLNSPLINDFSEQYADIGKAENRLPQDLQMVASAEAVDAIAQRLDEIGTTLRNLDSPHIEDFLGSVGPLDLKGVYKWSRYLLAHSRRAATIDKILRDRHLPDSSLADRLQHLDEKLGGIKDVLTALALRVRSVQVLRRILRAMSVLSGH